MLNILYTKLNTCYASIYNFTLPNENGNCTLPKEVQDDQWKLHFSNLQNNACMEVWKKSKRFALFWCNLAAWLVEFTVSFWTATFQISEAQHEALSVIFIRLLVSSHIWASV